MALGKMENVEVFNVPGKGRGLRATRKLRAGEVVFAEPSFAAVVFDSLSMQVCHSCFRRQDKLHRCAQCKFAHYCDRTCQRAGWEEHKQECVAIRKHGKAPNENIRLAARTLWRMQKDGGVVSDSQLTSVEQLEDHVVDMPADDLKGLKIDIHNFLGYWPHKIQQYTENRLSHIFGMITCNGFTLSDQRGLQAVGVGLFPNLCLANHDCWPNCTVILNHGKIELRALEKIVEGEELTVGYVDFLNVSTDRQRLLKQQYYFDCNCQHCNQHIKDDLMMSVKEVDGKKVVKLCQECLKKQEPVLGDTHLYLLRVLSMASEVLSYLQRFAEAANYAQRVVSGFTKLYHPNNAQLGMATMRSGVTHWHAGNIEVGHSIICKAFAILFITHGPCHPITKDLEAIRMQTEMELRMFEQNEAIYHAKREAALRPMNIVAI